MPMYLAITNCTDSLLWYHGLVGQLVPLVRDFPAESCWLCREPSGLANIVHHKDGQLVPQGYLAADSATVLQQQDLILINGQWISPPLDLLGKPVTSHLTIRRSNHD